ncbi:MAG: hypothetical protein AB1578_18240 [Thermodesulfobacteriota bacterium]
MELPILIFLMAGLLVYSFYPLLGPWRPLVGSGGGDRRRIAALEMERTGFLKAIKDVDFERATGKLSDADYEDLRSFYTAKAAEAIAALETLRDEAGRADDRP